MKAKTIKAVIRKKIDQWLESIDDPVVREQVADNVIVTGGCIASMLLKEPVNDFDVYFRDHATTLAVAKYYVARFKREHPEISTCIEVIEEEGRIQIKVKSAGVASSSQDRAYIAATMDDPGDIQDTYESTKQDAQDTVDDGKPQFRPVFLSTNAITLSHRVQLVLRFYGQPDEIHKNYDFVHCTNHWNSHDNELVLHAKALESLLARELVYVGSKYPVCSIIRLRKFIKRGWTINAGQILKSIMQISELDLTDINVLRDQLTGVDCAYFCQVIGLLQEKDPQKVNAAYLIEIIDRMF